ncbi:semialdehyde dehydrogenase family protein [Actinidia rufa]|uniref:Semialdehyde dehydrogenase family protein n=1 Tax=Actinidia rufa TaxID=165716 RepID=A0A7J0DR56_9ERIC|nr:semialdehyde dehydrogenase family protein [Actinidia rufa]
MSHRGDAPLVAVVGVTGAVGQEFLSVLSDRSFPYRSIKMLASKHSTGKRLNFEGNEDVAEELIPESFNGLGISDRQEGASCDSRSESRGYGSYQAWVGEGALIANPNCSTIICLMAATHLHRHAKVLPMVVSTYQAASGAGAGAGAAAMEELEQQTRENDMNVKVTATCIRVPVMRAHAGSVNLQFEMPIDEDTDTARDILRDAPGLVVIDDRAANHFPTPLEVSNKDDVAVGRIRSDVSQDGNYGLDIFVCGDQIRKGAALNAVQIAEML